MGLAASYNNAMYSQLQVYAAWFPVANTFELGDYGLIEGGIFRKMGNISEFKVTFKDQPSPQAKIDFLSEGAKVVRMVGDAVVKVLPQQVDGEAKITYTFSRANSCMIKADVIVKEMQNIKQVGDGLAALDDWDRRFRVVSSLYTGQKCAIVAAEKRNTTLEFTGTVNLLKQLESGKGSADLGFSSSDERIFKSIGESGVIGLGFFKIGWFGRTRRLAAPRSGQSVQVETDKVWRGELADDLSM
jgi:hypothetical protein